MNVAELAASGLLIGTLVGLTGMGGGSLMTPLLLIAFGFSPTVAVGTDLLHGAVFKSVGSIRHRQLGTVQARLSGWMFTGSAPTSLLGVVVATTPSQVGSSADAVGGHVLGGALVAGGCGLLALARAARRAVRAVAARPDRPGADRALRRFRRGSHLGRQRRLVRVDTAARVPPSARRRSSGRTSSTPRRCCGSRASGTSWRATSTLAPSARCSSGSIPGVLIGSQFTLRVPGRSLRLLLGTVLIASGQKLLGAPNISLLGPPLLLFMVAGTLASTSRASGLGGL